MSMKIEKVNKTLGEVENILIRVFYKQHVPADEIESAISSLRKVRKIIEEICSEKTI